MTEKEFWQSYLRQKTRYQQPPVAAAAPAADVEHTSDAQGRTVSVHGAGQEEAATTTGGGGGEVWLLLLQPQP